MTLEGHSLPRVCAGPSPSDSGFCVVSVPGLETLLGPQAEALRQLPGLRGSGVQPSTDPLRHAHKQGKGVALGGRERPIRHKCPGTNSETARSWQTQRRRVLRVHACSLRYPSFPTAVC